MTVRTVILALILVQIFVTGCTRTREADVRDIYEMAINWYVDRVGGAHKVLAYSKPHHWSLYQDYLQEVPGDFRGAVSELVEVSRERSELDGLLPTGCEVADIPLVGLWPQNGNQWIIWVSGVGFSEDRTRAAVACGYICPEGHLLCGEWGLYLLKRVDGEWKRDQVAIMIVS